MDMRTGQRYETAEAALAAGVPSSDIAEVDGDGQLVWFYEPVKMEVNPACGMPHQGARERARRIKTIGA